MLILQHRYILKLAGISCLYEVVVTVLDYQFKIAGAKHSISVTEVAGELIEIAGGEVVTYPLHISLTNSIDLPLTHPLDLLTHPL